MADITMKRGDTSPSLTATLTGADGAAQNLTGAAVRFKVWNRRRDVVIDEPCTILDPVAGTVQYDWDLADTEHVGHYEAEFEVTLLSEAVGTFPNDRLLVLEIVADIR